MSTGRMENIKELMIKDNVKSILGSIKCPKDSNKANITGTLNILAAITIRASEVYLYF